MNWFVYATSTSLCLFRKLQPVESPADLHFIRQKLAEMADRERAGGGEAAAVIGREQQTTDRQLDIVAKINPNEPVAIRRLRKKLRLMGRAWNNEKAYVKGSSYNLVAVVENP